MNVRSLIAWGLAAAILSSNTFLFAAGEGEAKKKKWKNSTELSYIATNGNTKTRSTSGKNTFLTDWTKWGLEVIAGGMGAKDQGFNTAEQYYASQKLDFKLAKKNYLYEKVRWDKDRFAGIKNRTDGTLGAGRRLYEDKRNLLTAEAGAGYTVEELIGANDNTFWSGRAYAKYIFTLSETSNFSQDVEYLPNLEDGDRYRVNTDTSLTSKINTLLSLKLSYLMRHNSQPPLGFGKTDTTTSAALVADF